MKCPALITRLREYLPVGSGPAIETSPDAPSVVQPHLGKIDVRKAVAGAFSLLGFVCVSSLCEGASSLPGRAVCYAPSFLTDSSVIVASLAANALVVGVASVVSKIENARSIQASGAINAEKFLKSRHPKEELVSALVDNPAWAQILLQKTISDPKRLMKTDTAGRTLLYAAIHSENPDLQTVADLFFAAPWSEEEQQKCLDGFFALLPPELKQAFKDAPTPLPEKFAMLHGLQTFRTEFWNKKAAALQALLQSGSLPQNLGRVIN